MPWAQTGALSIWGTPISGGVDGGDHQSDLEILNVKDYGAVGDGVADDTAEIQAAITAAMGNTLYFPPGHYKVSATLTLNGPNHIRMIGAGVNWTSGVHLDWVGNATTPFLHLRGIDNSLFEDFGLFCSTPFPLQVAIKSETVSGISLPGNNTFRRMWIAGQNGELQKGFQFIAGSGGDGNNSEMTFDTITVLNYSVCGVSFEQGQSKANRFRGCTLFPAGDRVAYGVSTALKPPNIGGSFTWLQGNMGAHAADFYLGAANDYVYIQSLTSEGSARFIEQVGGSAGGFPMLIQGCRWDSLNMHTDQRMIIFGTTGPVTLIGNILGGQGGSGIIPRIALNFGTSGAGYVSLIGNTFFTEGAAAVDLIERLGAGPYRITMFGNNYAPAGSGGFTVSAPTFVHPPLWLEAGIQVPATAAPATPGTGQVVVYAKADKLLYQKDDTGVETGLAGSGGGGTTFPLGTGVSFTPWADVILERAAADILAMRRTTNPQEFRLYETYTDASNYSGLRITTAGGTNQIIGTAAGTGTGKGLILKTDVGTALYLKPGNAQWIYGDDGTIYTSPTNTNDIGYDSLRPKMVHVGTGVNFKALGSDPATPPSGSGTLFLRSSDKKLYFINDAGTVTALF